MHAQVSPVVSFQWWAVMLTTLQDRLFLHKTLQDQNPRHSKLCKSAAPTCIYKPTRMSFSSTWCLGGQELHRDGQILPWHFTLWVHHLDLILILGEISQRQKYAKVRCQNSQTILHVQSVTICEWNFRKWITQLPLNLRCRLQGFGQVSKSTGMSVM